MNSKANHSIQCSVCNCANHCCDEQYCSLKEIKVGGCAPAVSNCDQTECASFVTGNTTCCK